MTLTPIQIREARALLRWTSPGLARRSNVGIEIVLRAQTEAGTMPAMGMELRAIREALEKGGIEFIPKNGGGHKPRRDDDVVDELDLVDADRPG